MKEVVSWLGLKFERKEGYLGQVQTKRGLRRCLRKQFKFPPFSHSFRVLYRSNVGNLSRPQVLRSIQCENAQWATNHLYRSVPPAFSNVTLYKIPPADPTRSINPDKYRISLLYPTCPALYLAAFYYHPGPLRVNPILNDISCIATLQHYLPNKRHSPPPQFS